MKRIVTLILALMMVLTLAVPALAADGDEPVTVTIGATYPRYVGVFDMCQIANRSC